MRTIGIFLLLLASAGGVFSMPDFQALEHPAAYYFRRPEMVAKRRITAVDDWVAQYSRLDGVILKCLDEETDRLDVVPYMQALKKKHPDQLVLLHYNHVCRATTFGVEKYWPGHWIYFEGSVTTGAIMAEKGESVIEVKQAFKFSAEIGFQKEQTDDICICALGKNGKPDWNTAEYAKVVSVDRKAGSIRVKRAQFGTKPLAFDAGKAYVAPLAIRFAPKPGKPLRWLYNYSTACPRDPQGRNGNDAQLEDFRKWFSPGGYCEGFDGATFDVSFHTAKARNTRNRKLDINGDGVADEGLIDGVNVYGLGVMEFYKKLRKLFGPDKLILADGQSSENQRAFGIINGMESEGFPYHHDDKIKDWSGGVNRLLYWLQNSGRPRFNYVVHKHVLKETESVNTPFSTKRLVLAMGPLTDAAIVPGEHDVIPASDNPAATWDEAFGGTLHKNHWLGKVDGPLIRVGLRSPDLLNGAGREMSYAFSKLWKKGDNCVIQKKGKSLLLKGSKEEADIRFGLELPKEHRGDLLVSCTLRSLPPPNMPETVARLVRVKLDDTVQLYPGAGQGEEVSGIMTWAGKKPFTAVFYFRDVPKSKPVLHFVAESGVPLEISKVTMHAAPDALARKFENGVVLCNPAHSEYTFDLGKLFPGVKLRRLQATSKQDVKTNNGKPVGKTVTLGPLDALFLRKQ